MIVVLGMHASGTTMLAEMIHTVGYDVKPPMLGADKRHPNGYFESQEIVDINRKILSLAGGNWEKPPKHENIMTVDINTKVKGHDLIKDPRLCLTLPLWDFDCKMVLIERPQVSVALSLSNVSKIPLRDGARLWKTYKQRVEKNLLGRNYLKVHYENLLKGEVEELAEYLETDRVNEMRKIIDIKLRHF